MTVVWADAPGEWYNSATGVYNEVNGTAVSFATVDGRRCMSMPPTGNVRRTGLSSADFVISGSCKFLAASDNGTIQIFRGLNGTAQECDIIRAPGGIIAVTRNGTVLQATLPGVLPVDAWSWISFGCHVADSPNGTWSVIVNGVSVLSGSGDTHNSGTVGITRLQVGNENATSGTPNWYCRDIIMETGTATPRNQRRVAYLQPDGAGNSTQWTPSAGSNYQNVDERDGAPDDATTYNAENTIGDKDLYTLAALPEAASAVDAVVEVARLAKDNATAQTVRRVLRTNSTDFESGDLVMSTTWTWYLGSPRETNPQTTAAWTASEIAALEMGVKKQA